MLGSIPVGLVLLGFISPSLYFVATIVKKLISKVHMLLFMGKCQLSTGSTKDTLMTDYIQVSLFSLLLDLGILRA